MPAFLGVAVAGVAASVAITASKVVGGASAAVTNLIAGAKIVAAIVAGVLFIEALLMWIFGMSTAFVRDMVLWVLIKFFYVLVHYIIIPIIGELLSLIVSLIQSTGAFGTGVNIDFSFDLFYPIIYATNDWFPIVEIFAMFSAYVVFIGTYWWFRKLVALGRVWSGGGF